MDIYKENGYKNRMDYMMSIAEDFNVDLNTVISLAELYGETEDFDGLLMILEDVDINRF